VYKLLFSKSINCRNILILVLLGLVSFPSLSRSQILRLKLYPGYLKVLMKDVNNNMRNQINIFSEISEILLPFPEDFNGNKIYGAQLNYHLNENYFFNFGFYSYKESVGSEMKRFLNNQNMEFKFDRSVELLNLILGLQYYFNYATWKPANYYLFSDLGIAFAASHSLTYTKNLPNYKDTNTRGNFTANSITFQVGFGVDINLQKYLSVWLQGGFLFANIGQMEGEIELIDGSRLKRTTNSRFDYSGILLMTGLGILLPF